MDSTLLYTGLLILAIANILLVRHLIAREIEDAATDDPWGEEGNYQDRRDCIHMALEELTRAADSENNIEALWYIDQLRGELLKCPMPEHTVTPLTPTKEDMLGQQPLVAEACCDELPAYRHTHDESHAL